MRKRCGRKEQTKKDKKRKKQPGKGLNKPRKTAREMTQIPCCVRVKGGKKRRHVFGEKETESRGNEKEVSASGRSGVVKRGGRKEGKWKKKKRKKKETFSRQ